MGPPKVDMGHESGSDAFQGSARLAEASGLCPPSVLYAKFHREREELVAKL